MIINELGAVEIRLPFKQQIEGRKWYGKKYTKEIVIEKTVGFRFNILAWQIMCQLFEPEIEFFQIEELQKSNPKGIFEKMVLAGALSYHFKYKNNPIVTESDIDYWLNKMPSEQAEKIKLDLQITILNSKIMGKTMSFLIAEDQEEKEKKN
jgi:hypothetical protein